MDPSLYEISADVQDDHWWFAARRRILDTLLSGLGDRRRVLEVGCGTGANAPILGRYQELLGLDMDQGALRHAKNRYHHVVQADALSMPLSDGCCDLVVALDLLEHLDDDEIGARELYRVLEADGSALVFVPAFAMLWGVQDDLSHHRRRYRRSQLVALLRGAGFRVKRTGYFNFWLFLPILLVRSLWRLGRPSLPSENLWTPGWVNRPLEALMGSEAWLLRHMDLPVGVSLYAIAEKAAD
ncbi:MAG: class I SAM-dependent methyltransferase [Deltaproteobacteria bacterium]|nr:class I SAM-dependent methyltransferase [Deltaproteobacteria bacterium]